MSDYNQNVARRMKAEMDAFENNPIAKGQQALDWWWEQKLAARARAGRPDVVSEYSPIAKFEAEMAYQEELAGRAYTRRSGR
jgi:hypothetical protein